MSFDDVLAIAANKWTSLTIFYTHLTQHIVPGPHRSCYFLPFVLLPIALLIPPSRLSHLQLGLIFLPLIWACYLHVWSADGIDVLSINLTLWSFVLLAWQDPRRTHRRIWVAEPGAIVGGKGSEDGAVDVKEESYPAELSKRIPWVLTLVVSLRLTGWKTGDPSHDRTQPPRWLSRLAFLKVALGTVLQSYIIMDVSSYYVQTDPYFVTSGMGVDEPFPSPSMEMPTTLVLLRMLPPRLIRSSVLAGQIYSMVTSMFFIPTIPAVAFNAVGLLPDEWSPQTWPLFFGDFSEVGQRGLRGLWGSWWHAMNRHMTATHGRSLTQVLKIPTKSTLGFAILTISAFFFSGVIHMGIIPPEPESNLLSAKVMMLYVAAFFWAQIPAFGIELAVSGLVARVAPQATGWRTAKLVVLMWSSAWLCLTIPLLTVPFREIGYWRYYSVPISLLQGLAGKGWVTWRFHGRRKTNVVELE